MKAGMWSALHTSGTKFYEIVVLPATADPDGETLEIRRWGKAEYQHKSGGQIEVHKWSSWAQAAASFSAYRGKKTKGGYTTDARGETTSFAEAMLALPAMSATEALMRAKPVAGKYNTAHRAKITDALRDVVVSDLPSKIDIEDDGTVVEVEKTPEPVRSDDWGSW